MRKLFPLFCLLLAACASVLPTPNDFPPPPSTVIVEFPTAAFFTQTPEPRRQPVTEDDMVDARNFLLILRTRVAAGDDYGIAESVKYPITVNVGGPVEIFTAEEFVAQYDRIFNDKVIHALTNMGEEDLIRLPPGIRIGQGEIWFDLFCVDAACSDTQFLITQINN